MLFTDTDIEEFIGLARKDGVELTREAAVEAATRLVLLYLRLALPTPSEVTAERLAKPSERGKLTDGRST